LNCNNKSITITGTGTAVALQGNGITVKNCSINVDADGAKGVSVDSGTNNVVQNSIFHSQKTGVTGIYLNTASNTLSNNTLCDWPTTNAINPKGNVQTGLTNNTCQSGACAGLPATNVCISGNRCSIGSCPM
jgi:hypothetical protein